MSKVIIITGAGRRLGKAFAIGLSRLGYRVVATGTDQSELDDVASRMQSDFMTQVCDITKVEDCQTLVANVKAKYGTVDVLINNAGIYMDSSFVDTDPGKLKAVMDVVVTGTAVVSREALAAMQEQRSGQIVSILDAEVRSGLPAFDAAKPYSVDYGAKIAKARFTDALRREAASYGVKVTSFYMHWVASELDIDDTSAAPQGATHPHDAVMLINEVILNGIEEADLPPSN